MKITNAKIQKVFSEGEVKALATVPISYGHTYLNIDHPIILIYKISQLLL